MQLPHFASRIYGTPLLIARAKLEIILAALGDRIGWKPAEAALPIPAPRPMASAPPGIALIPVYGTLVRRTLGLEAASGLASYGDIASMLAEAVADPVVEGILLDVDSPGGEAGGVFELAEAVRAADLVKPVWAIASDSAFSAAYAIASAASRLVVTRTGGVGSIGVIAMHVDQSVKDTQDGYRYTALYAGARKNDFSPHAQLSDEAAKQLQAEVDRLYGMFVGHVAAMRGLSEEAVRSSEAGLYFGEEALAAGLADAVGSFDALVPEFSDFLSVRRARNAAARSMVRSASNQKENLRMEHPDTQVPDTPTPSENAEVQSVAPEAQADQQERAATTEPDVQSAVTAAQSQALAIAELCQLAGHPERTAGFLAAGASEQSVRQALLATRAQSEEITSVIHPEAKRAAASPDQNPLIRAVKNICGKE